MLFRSLYDSFKEAADSSKIKRDYSQFTTGLYVQDNWDINEKLLLEGGLRLDYVLDYGLFVLPRLSLLYKISDKISTRLGGGLGYKTPTIFSEQTESLSFKNVIPLSANIRTEHSYGGSFDVNYKTALSDNVFLSINQLFFCTQINQPLVSEQDAINAYYFQNATLPVRSYGFETNARLVIDNWIKLFAAYSYTEVKAEYISGDNKDIPLVPKQRLLFNLVFEKEHNFKWAFEGYYSDKQRLTNGNYSPTFWELGMAAEKTFNNIIFFINVENFLDVRQNRFGQVVFPPHNNPTFAEIYTHTEGRVFNGGIKIKF